MSHTPGPWSVSYSEVHGADGKYVAKINTFSRDGEIDPAEANGRLIAAAPDMLEALVETLAAFEAFMEDVDWGKSALSGSTIYAANAAPMQARAAIKKATGQ